MDIRITNDMLISVTHFIVLILLQFYDPHGSASSYTLPSFIEYLVAFHFSASLHVYYLVILPPPLNLKISGSFSELI